VSVGSRLYMNWLIVLMRLKNRYSTFSSEKYCGI
jgi:hypothetical protein